MTAIGQSSFVLAVLPRCLFISRSEAPGAQNMRSMGSSLDLEAGQRKEKSALSP